jgi:hypothetical protein
MDGIRPLFAIYLAGSGHADEAREQLTEDALAISRADHDMAYWVGATYALLGETDNAFKWLNKAVKLGNHNKPHFENDPNIASLHADERWNELLAKIDEGLANGASV